MPGYAGWDPTHAAADYAATGGAGKQGIDMNAEIDNTYNDVYGQLGALENQVNSGKQSFLDHSKFPLHLHLHK